MTRYRCPHCGAFFDKPGSKKPGKRIKCPECGREVYRHPDVLHRPEAPKVIGTSIDQFTEEEKPKEEAP